MKSLRLCLLLLALLSLCLAAQAQPAPVKNVIIMIGDGCGFNEHAAGSLYTFGKPDGWAYQQFPVRYGCTTFPAGGSYDPAAIWGDFGLLRMNATDSAAAGTALACGVKTYNGAIGVGPDKQPVQNVLEAAEKVGKATGVVSSVPFSHATPAAFVAHNEGRGDYLPIAAQMLASRCEVIMGGGHPEFDNSNKPREAKYQYVGQDVYEQAKAGTLVSDADGDGQPDAWKLVQTKAGFEALTQPGAPKRVFGLAQVAETLQEGRGGDTKADAYVVPFSEGVPSLSTMTIGALNVLSADPDGFAVMIEGGAIDWAGHSNLSGRVIEEQADFGRAIEAVIGWVEKNSNWSETLLIVTSDHETGYLTGPGSDPKWQPLVNNGQGKMPGMQWNYGSHTNSLVPVYAKGAWSDELKKCQFGVDPIYGPYLDNTDLPKLVFRALGG